MRNAVAFANNDVATIAWSYGAKPKGCMGFALYRIDSRGQETALPSIGRGKKMQKPRPAIGAVGAFCVTKPRFSYRPMSAASLGKRPGVMTLGDR
jgi:hypothetical protein